MPFNTQGLLQDPMLGMGLGLLQGAQPGGTFAGGSQQGLMNMMRMRQAGTQNELAQMKLEAARGQAQRRKTLSEAYAGTQPTPFPEGTWGEGYMQQPTVSPQQFQGLLKQEVLQEDPAKAYGLLYPQTKPTSQIQNYQYLKEIGFPDEEALKRAFSGGVNVNIGGDKLVTPSDAQKIILPSGEAPPPGTRYADLPAMKAKFVDKKTPEQAAKISMIQTAVQQFPQINKLMFDEKGDPNWTNITNAQLGTWGTEGRTLAGAYEFGIQAITRGETGAAMPPEEVKNTRLRFQPKLGDTKVLVNIKWDMYQDFLKGTLKLIDTTLGFPKLDTMAFDAELQRRIVAAGEKSIISPPLEVNPALWDVMTPEERKLWQQ